MRFVCKMFCGLILLCLCGCQCCDTFVQNNEKCDTSKDALIVSAKQNYADIFMDYERLIAFRLSENFENDYNQGNEIQLRDDLQVEINDKMVYKWSCMLVNMTAGLDNPTKNSFGYILKDINCDNIPELFWVREDRIILAVFTICGHEAHLIDAYWPGYECIVTEESYLYTRATSGWNYNAYQLFELTPDSNNVELLLDFGEEGMSYYETIDNKKTEVDKDRFDELLFMYPFRQSAEWEELQVFLLS